ncbi:MAG: TolC family protein [Bacteroidota bacterium]
MLKLMPGISHKNQAKNGFLVLFFSVLLLAPAISNSQKYKTDTVRSIDLEKAMQIAEDRNLRLENAELRTKQIEKNKQGLLDLKPTEIDYRRGELYSEGVDQRLEVVQSLGSPLKSFYEGKKIQHEKKLQETNVELIKNELLRDVKMAYFDWIFLFSKEKILQKKVNLYKEFKRISKLENELGETALLEYTKVETEFMEARNELNKVFNKLAIAKNNLKELLNIDHTLIPERDTLEIYKIDYQIDSSGRYKSPLIRDYYDQQLEVSKQELKMTKAELFPDIRVGYFDQEINNVTGFNGWMLGVSVPLWFLPNNAEIQKAKIQTQINRNEFKSQLNRQEKNIKNLAHQLNTYHDQIVYYRNNALDQADRLLNMAEKKYDNEDIEYYEYMESLKNAYSIKLNYLRLVRDYNKTAAKLEFYIN